MIEKSETSKEKEEKGSGVESQFQPPIQERKLLEIAMIRWNFISNYLKDVDSLVKALEGHPRRQVIEKRIGEQVRRISLPEDFARLLVVDHEPTAKEKEKSTLSKSANERLAAAYIDAYKNNLVELSDVFTEVPSALTLCELNKLLQWFVEYAKNSQMPDDQVERMKNIIIRMIVERGEYIENRFQRITGQPDFIRAFPTLSTLLENKAPIPLNPKWKTELYHSERISTPTGDPQLDISSATGEEQAVVESEETIDTEPQDDEGSTDTEAPKDSSCDMDELYTLAGANRPQQPGPETPRHTFPGRLSIGEDIYYDYAVFIPINDCGTCGQQVYTSNESMIGLRLLAGKIAELVRVLDEWQVSKVLGETNGSILLQEITTHISAISISTPINTALQRRANIKKLREYASIVRTIARTELLKRNPEASDFIEIATELKNRADNVGFTIDKRRLPQKSNDDKEYDLEDALIPDGQTLVQAQWAKPLGGTPSYVYKRKRDDTPKMQWDYFGPYMRHLGKTFGPKIKQLKDKAYELSSLVISALQGNSSSINEFRQVLAGWINDILLNMAELIDQLAEILPINKDYRQEGSLQVGLQVLYRQYWNPIGYVRGKLIGYKNLIPNQTETLSRRTFIKTTEEITTSSQFSAMRQTDFSNTQRETAEINKEIASDFKFTQTASGRYDVGVWGVHANTSINNGVRENTRAKQNMFSEAVQKGSTKFNEKRETKVRQLIETEDVEEVKTELHNSNSEITANYFYYQLLREYRISIEMHDIIPVLMRTKSVPGKSEIDDHFISRYIHILTNRLPPQLAKDAMENVEEVDLLAKDLFRKRAEFDQRQVEYDQYRSNTPPALDDREHYNEWVEGMRTRENALNEARNKLTEVDEAYTRARSRLNRVVSHVRENRLYYMQYIWQANSTLDDDELLYNEKYCNQLLPEITRGLMRVGYLGREEIFEYTGVSLDLFEALLDRMVPGSEIASMPPELLQQTTLFQYMARYYPEDTVEELIDRIRSHSFVEDFSANDEVLSERYVQIAQDALVVETMPGQVPLLEGFQMAHRMLDVQKSCLENRHLSERMADRPWIDKGSDSYAIRRYEGSVPPEKEVTEES